MTATSGEVPFPPEEMAARLARVRRAMGAGGIDALIVLAPDNQYWLCGLESFISGVLPQALIVPAEDERQMLLQVWDADAPLARATATVEQIYGYRVRARKLSSWPSLRRPRNRAPCPLGKRGGRSYPLESHNAAGYSLGLKWIRPRTPTTSAGTTRRRRGRLAGRVR